MKRCSQCDSEKPVAEFRRDKSKADGFQPSCKDCVRTKIAQRYQERYKVRINARTKSIRDANSANLAAYKRARGCLICTETDDCCLEFHHPDPTAKEFTIAQERSRSWAKLLTEIEKCVVVCSNCHKKVHANKISLLSSSNG